jgi:hypothetical protein
VSWQGTVNLHQARLVGAVTGIELASRAWKARPVSSSGADDTPMAQVSPARDRPLLTVTDRQMPLLRARGGHGRRGQSWFQRAGDGHKLDRRVRPVHDNLPRWQALIEGAAASCRLAVAECEGPVRLQRRVRRVVDVAGRAIGPVPNA